jgi:hypothetical protein
LEDFADIYVLPLTFAYNLTTPALQAAVKAVGQRVVKFQDAGEQIFYDLQSAVSRHGFDPL